MCSSQDKQAPPAATEARHLAIVGGLLIVIIASLAALWGTERYRRNLAEGYLSDMHAKNSRLSEAAAQMALSAQGRPVRRADLPTEEVMLDGRRRIAFRLGEDAGQRMGFAPGDVIMVSTRPAETQRAP